jgi:formylglycine-generating enzyme required for sulfatase activity/tRNA A-37 threonylcarbamoyl transferase component Bud32
MNATDPNDPLRTRDYTTEPPAALPNTSTAADAATRSFSGAESTKSHQSAVSVETLETHAPDLKTPTVPGYEILGVLGRGGMGVVYKARHLTLKRIVALKMVLAGEHASPQQKARFRLEAEAVARLQHPNIVQIHEVGESGGHPYCALEFVEGGNLAGKMDGKPLTARESARLAETLARAIQLAHSRNVVHRDLKPANVLLAIDGTPKITDFGLARQMDSDSGETQAGAVIGTPSYMAPEQASGRANEAGPQADIYALGAILYECLTGRPPFKEKTVVETLDQVRSQEPVPPSRLQPNLPLDLETICLKCLRKEPEKRYASAAELADDLARYQRGEPIQARPVGRIERAVKWVKRNPVVAALMLVAVLGVAGVVWKYFDAERAKGLAEERQSKAEKARDFLVSILRIAETDSLGGNITAREILARAEARIPKEFEDQPELKHELMAAIAQVKRGIARRVPQAMILEVSGAVRLQSATGKDRKADPQALVYLDDRLTVPAEGKVQLVFISDFHKEHIKAGREVTVEEGRCEPPDAILERDNSILMTFVRLPKATFYMGWDSFIGQVGRPEETRGVPTEIKDDFEIAVHDVTQGQWQAIMGENPSNFSRKGAGKHQILDVSDEELKLFPVETVSWNDVQVFLAKLNEKERGRGYVYRLPTDEEWEYACRGGATSEEDCSHHFYLNKPTNQLLSPDQANVRVDDPTGKTTKPDFMLRPTRVGAYPSNNLGLCDMHGNVWQWTSSLLPTRFAPRENYRVYRGGCYMNSAGESRTALKNGFSLVFQGDRKSYIGFRLARVREDQQLVKKDPNKVEPPPNRNPFLLLAQARTQAGKREWDKAVKAYAAIIDGPLPDAWGHVAYEYAAVLLLSGDVAGYRKMCGKLVERCGQPNVRSFHVARACSLAPGSFTPAERPRKLAEVELKDAGTAFWSLWLQGALQYRAGKFPDALSLLQRSRDDGNNSPDGVAGTRLWLALTYHQLNKPDEARREFDQAEHWLKQYPDGIPPDAERRLRLHLHNWLEVHVLRLEVAPLLKPGSGKNK